MSDEAKVPASDYDHVVVLQELEGIIGGYQLPHDFNQLMQGPWMDIANTMLELFGEESDPWRRMLWFSRIVCNALSTSLTRGDAESLEQALHTFMIWLRLCNQETESLDLALVAAEYLCKRMKIQMMASLGGDEICKGVEASAPMPEAFEESMPEAEQEPADESPGKPEESHQQVAEVFQEDGIPPDRLDSVEEQPAGVTATVALAEADVPQNLTEYANPEHLSESLESNDSQNPVEQEPSITDTMSHEYYLNGQAITNSAGDVFMDIPTLSEKLHTPLDNESESTTGRDSGQAMERASVERSKSTTIVPVGIWLGFHDEDVSTMVKLAVYDRANDNYIFANKQGFLVRQMNTPDLLDLIENQLVDIIERRLVTRKPAI